jgi:hypothetical protein
MTEVPTIWLWVSGLFFFFGLLLFMALGVFVVFLIKWMKEMKPKIESISNRVDAIGKNVEELTEHVKATTASVGGRAQSVAASVDSIASLASSTFERFSPYVAGAMTAMKLISGFVQMRKSMSPKALESQREKTRTKRGKG